MLQKSTCRCGLYRPSYFTQCLCQQFWHMRCGNIIRSILCALLMYMCVAQRIKLIKCTTRKECSFLSNFLSLRYKLEPELCDKICVTQYRYSTVVHNSLSCINPSPFPSLARSLPSSLPLSLPHPLPIPSLNCCSVCLYHRSDFMILTHSEENFLVQD